jgi:hypothetical protein
LIISKYGSSKDFYLDSSKEIQVFGLFMLQRKPGTDAAGDELPAGLRR